MIVVSLLFTVLKLTIPLPYNSGMSVIQSRMTHMGELNRTFLPVVDPKTNCVEHINNASSAIGHHIF